MFKLMMIPSARPCSQLLFRNFAVTGRHSKNVAAKKNKLDLLKNKKNGRLAIKIIKAVKAGGNDPASNTDLSRALREAQASQLPKDIINRALSKGDDKSSADYVSDVFEVFGHGGVSLLVCTVSDNRLRTIPLVKEVAKKAEVKLASTGSVLFQFDHKGYFQPNNGYSPDLVLVAAIEAELDEIDFIPNANNDDETEEPDTVLTDADLVGPLQDVMDSLGIQGSSGQMYVPQAEVEVRSAEEREANEALVEAFEALDDVDAVYHNMKERR